jgi:hypothetical protein
MRSAKFYFNSREIKWVTLTWFPKVTEIFVSIIKSDFSRKKKLLIPDEKELSSYRHCTLGKKSVCRKIDIRKYNEQFEEEKSHSPLEQKCISDAILFLLSSVRTFLKKSGWMKWEFIWCMRSFRIFFFSLLSPEVRTINFSLIHPLYSHIFSLSLANTQIHAPNIQVEGCDVVMMRIDPWSFKVAVHSASYPKIFAFTSFVPKKK